MTITLNGQKKTVENASTVLELLAEIGLGGRPVVVELNQQALLAREHTTAILNEGDAIEIVQITAGG